MIRILAAVLAMIAAPAAAEPASAVFARATLPTAASPAPHGSYAKGCLAGGVALAETGPSWQVMRLSRNRYWGHPALTRFVGRLAEGARAEGWPGLWVGDLGMPRGGPMPSGHASHQIGLDADIWLRRPDRLDLTREEREAIGSRNMVDETRLRVSDAWTPGHLAIVRRAAQDPAVARIFVNAAIKRELCESAAGDRDWLGKVRPWWGHDHHMHVRLACPPGAGPCVDQAPPPPGNGCDGSLDWWFTEEALNPPPTPPDQRPAPLTLADLPPACAGIAATP